MARDTLFLLAGERVRNETTRAVLGCNDYLRMGPGRSLPKLLAHYQTKADKLRQKNESAAENESAADPDPVPVYVVPTLTMSTLKRWSSDYSWQERVAEYEAEQDRLATARRDEIMQSGLALDYERVKTLGDMADLLSTMILDTDSAGDYFNIWLKDYKRGSGPDAELEEIERFNHHIFNQWRGMLKDLAAETGGRRTTGRMENLNIDLERLTDYQLDRLVAGESLINVLLSPNAGPGGES